MRKKRLWIPVTSMLCVSLLTGSILPAYAANTGQATGSTQKKDDTTEKGTTAAKKETGQATGTTAAEESTADPDFEWDDETKDDALTVFDTTDWTTMQSKLLYKDSQMNGSAKATVSSEVRDLESTVKSVLNDDTFDADLEYYRSDYVELTLAMIQVLAEQSGAIGADGENAVNFNDWIKTMGQMIEPGTSAGKKQSIHTLINAYTLSTRAYRIKKLKDNNGKEDSDISEPYIYKNDSELQAVIEGVVMRYATGNQVYVYTSECDTTSDKPYTEKEARNYYKKHKKEIKAYYANSTIGGTNTSGGGVAAGAATDTTAEDDKDTYLPDSAFADNVASIYSTSGGLGEDMAAYVSSCPNEKVAAFLNELAKHNKKPYVWGAVGPDSFDCSGLISYCLKKSGAIPNYSRHTSSGMESSFKHVPYSEVQPGDILWHPGHVMVYLKDGYTFEAKGKAYGVGYFKRTTSTQTVLRWW